MIRWLVVWSSRVLLIFLQWPFKSFWEIHTQGRNSTAFLYRLSKYPVVRGILPPSMEALDSDQSFQMLIYTVESGSISLSAQPDTSGEYTAQALPSQEGRWLLPPTVSFLAYILPFYIIMHKSQFASHHPLFRGKLHSVLRLCNQATRGLHSYGAHALMHIQGIT